MLQYLTPVYPLDSSDETGETPNKHKCVRRLQSQLDDSFEIKQRPSVSLLLQKTIFASRFNFIAWYAFAIAIL